MGEPLIERYIEEEYEEFGFLDRDNELTPYVMEVDTERAEENNQIRQQEAGLGAEDRVYLKPAVAQCVRVQLGATHEKLPYTDEFRMPNRRVQDRRNRMNDVVYIQSGPPKEDGSHGFLVIHSNDRELVVRVYDILKACSRAPNPATLQKKLAQRSSRMTTLGLSGVPIKKVGKEEREGTRLNKDVIGKIASYSAIGKVEGGRTRKPKKISKKTRKARKTRSRKE